MLIGARDKQNANLAGMVITVPPGSPAHHLAQNNEAEMHLLGIMPNYRGYGLGRLLVEEAVNAAKQGGFSKILLLTQVSMVAAQELYQSSGFLHTRDIRINGKDFLIYEKQLCN